MPDYSRRAGAPNESGRDAVNRLDQKVDAARRDRPQFDKQDALVKLGLEEVESWAPGTTRLVGDDYPFEVKLTDGTWLPIPAPATGGAGSIGSSTATGSHVLLSPGVLAFGGWSFSQAFDGVSTGNPTLTAGPGGNDFSIGEAGWYQLGIVKRADFTSGTPGALEVEINLSSVGYEPVWTIALASAADNPQGIHGAMVDVGTRALYLTAGEVVSPRMRWAGGGTMYASALTVFVTRLG